MKTVGKQKFDILLLREEHHEVKALQEAHDKKLQEKEAEKYTWAKRRLIKEETKASERRQLKEVDLEEAQKNMINLINMINLNLKTFLQRVLPHNN